MKQTCRLGRGYLSLQTKRRGRKQNRLLRDVEGHGATSTAHDRRHGTRPATGIFANTPTTFQKLPRHQKHSQNAADAPRTQQTLPERSTRLSNARQPPGTPRTAHDRRSDHFLPPDCHSLASARTQETAIRNFAVEHREPGVLAGLTDARVQWPAHRHERDLLDRPPTPAR